LRYGLGLASAQKRVKKGRFYYFLFLRCHDVRSREAVKSAFWNLAVSGKVSRSAEFGCIWVYGVGTAGEPKRAEQGFVAEFTAVLFCMTTCILQKKS
jgi:hypothetical protein